MKSITRISLVDHGDNPKASIVIVKRASEQEASVDVIVKKIRDATDSRSQGDPVRHAIVAETFVEANREFFSSFDTMLASNITKHAASRDAIEAKIDTLAAALREKDPALTKEMAFAKVWKSSPELREQYDQAEAREHEERGLARMGKGINYSEVVGELQEAIAPGDPSRGLLAVRTYFPNIYKAYLRAPLRRRGS